MSSNEGGWVSDISRSTEAEFVVINGSSESHAPKSVPVFTTVSNITVSSALEMLNRSLHTTFSLFYQNIGCKKLISNHLIPNIVSSLISAFKFSKLTSKDSMKICQIYSLCTT